MAAHTLGSRPRTGDVLQGPDASADFSSLLLSRPVLEGLVAAGFTKPSPIQSKAIPLGRCGLDLIVQAKSGTGKTCVFSTVALDSLILENMATQILVLAPTREIAVQIHSVIISIGSRMEGLECHVFIGGTPLPQDKGRLKKCHIAVGSPGVAEVWPIQRKTYIKAAVTLAVFGRIKQLIEIGYLNTSSIRLFILDEADKLLEEGSFQEQINWIYSSLPANKQMLAVSATYPESLAKALTRYMREPTFVRLNVTDPSLIGLKQYYKVVNSHPLPHKTFEEKIQHLQELFSRVPFNQALVFSNLHSRAKHLSDVLTAKGFPAVCISGGMNQNQRLDAMAKLKQYHCRVLISTDLTSRGIDAEKVNLVINLDVPHDWETYMHRIGRAGRFGTYGLSVSYCCRGEEENLMMSIAQKCNLRLLALPEPIPDGLMEEACDWNVEIMSTTNTSQVVMSDVKTDDCLKTQNAGINTLPESSMSKKPTQPKQKKISKRKSTEKENPQEWMHVETSNLPKKPEKPKKTEEGLESEGKLQQGLHNSLPKIPSLASFKRPVVCTSSFAELVEDYEQFIKEGLEKHVEVIRVYTDAGGHAERVSSENLGQENSSTDMSDAVITPDNFNPSVNSREESYSSSSSLSESEDTSEEAQEKVKAKEPSSSYPALSAQGTDGAPVCHMNVDELSVPSEDIQQATLVKDNSSSAKDVIISKKLRKRAKKVTQLSRRELCPETQDDMYQLDYMNAGAFPYGTMSYADYWRSYYQAWQNYHSAVSSPYYRNICKCSSWMSAYHMHSVYLHEMLKP